jgi:hypothetical protein
MMKKLLLGSTALVAGGLLAAPAMAADPIKIGVGGYYQFYALAGSVEGVYAPNGSSVQYKGLQFQQEGEIHFIGQSKLDNGTTVGLTVELEGWNPNPGAAGASQQIDEAFLFAFGDWGRIEFGARDMASYRMYYGATSALLGYGAFQHNFGIFNLVPAANNKAATRVTLGTIGGQFQDANRVNYFTPRFMGLQIGAGYAPKMNVGGTTGTAIGPGAGLGICGTTDATNFAACPVNDYSYQDVFDVGLNYLNKFGDVTVAAYGAFMYATFNPGFQFTQGVGSNTLTGANLTSWKQWVVGLQFGYAGFTLGGSYSWDNNGLGANYYTGMGNETRSFMLSAMYETGPWQLSFLWAHAINDNGNGSASVCTIANGTNAVTLCTPGGTNAAFGQNTATGALSFGTERANKFEIGANYALGPGIKLVGGALMYNLSGPSNAVAGQSWGILLGMDLRF